MSDEERDRQIGGLLPPAAGGAQGAQLPPPAVGSVPQVAPGQHVPVPESPAGLQGSTHQATHHGALRPPKSQIRRSLEKGARHGKPRVRAAIFGGAAAVAATTAVVVAATRPDDAGKEIAAATTTQPASPIADTTEPVAVAAPPSTRQPVTVAPTATTTETTTPATTTTEAATTTTAVVSVAGHHSIVAGEGVVTVEGLGTFPQPGGVTEVDLTGPCDGVGICTAHFTTDPIGGGVAFNGTVTQADFTPDGPNHYATVFVVPHMDEACGIDVTVTLSFGIADGQIVNGRYLLSAPGSGADCPTSTIEWPFTGTRTG